MIVTGASYSDHDCGSGAIIEGKKGKYVVLYVYCTVDVKFVGALEFERREKWEGLDSSIERESAWEKWEGLDSSGEKWNGLDSSAREKWEGLLSGLERKKRVGSVDLWPIFTTECCVRHVSICTFKLSNLEPQ